MANFTLDQLLQYPPLEALLIAFNDTHGTQLNPRFVTVDQVFASAGPEVIVRLSAIQAAPNAEANRFINSCDITVVRQDIGEVFGHSFTVDYSGEIVSHDVASIITRRTGVVFAADDFLTEVITPETNRLVAAPTSLRWYGELAILKA